ncbi:hypothetical protein CVT25_003547 [Psilocybe cyanescens]|uniref:t-SNARE coiled-coil homology domain-containing protein n=1 Tax=Psilocybe cyanescens TaxID=93625 RepID=A0A409WNW9_PSICY|nr:hypothetical protein CVT25_003547 [Psilocybe cyanescens]
MEYDTEPQHDEINLIRLVRRLEKSVASSEEWKPTASLPKEEIWLKASRSLQNIKFARKLVKNLEADDFEPPPKRLNQLNDTKAKLERIESFLNDVEKATEPETRKSNPILPTLPVPRPPLTPSHIESSQDSQQPPPLSPPHEPKEKSPSPAVSTNGLFISPPDPDELSPTLITSALPSLLPSSYPPETATTSSFSRNFGPIPTARKVGGAHASTAVQEELSSQLELMAQQLKRNAMHFSTSLEKDKAVVEDAQSKLEGNYDMMQQERVRLRDHSGKSRSTTCMTLGIVILVLLVFMLMVSVIRFS